MKFWSTTRLWEGRTCAVLASGPSLTQEIADAFAQTGCPAIAINNTGISRAPWANILYAADAKWWTENEIYARRFAGVLATMVPNNPSMHGFLPVIPGTLILGNGGYEGFDERPDHMRSGWNSGYQAVHLAAHLGARRILLLGFDMHRTHGEHWHPDHKWRPGHKSNYGLFMHSFNGVAPEYKRRGIEIINCTQGSALKCFPLATVEEGLNDAVQYMRESQAQVAGSDAQSLGRTGT